MSRRSTCAAHALQLILAIALLGATTSALAQSLPAFTSTPAPGGGQNFSLSVQTLLILTGLTFIPAALLMMTSFTRIIIVLALLRHALGLQTSPPNQVLVGITLFLTFFVMSPVAEKIYTEAYLPFADNRLSFSRAIETGGAPLKQWMLKQTRTSDIEVFAKIAREPQAQSNETLAWRILIPAFITSELKTAFQIGFLVFVPFLIIDMIVASALMSMGMMMMSPVMVSLPFKLMLFVLVDGWTLLMGSLVQSFA